MFFLPNSINIQAIKVNSMDNLSSVSLSNNMKRNRNVSAKKSQGIGQQHADGVLSLNTFSYVIDDEMLDSMSKKKM